MKPFFSIIIPVYNVAPHLRECLDSVLNQTFPEWEAICVDDGSTDGSGDILDEYAVRDSRFHVIHKENGGVSSARNAALDVAQGEWILFLDGDDLIKDIMLERLKSYVCEFTNVSMVSFNTVRFVDKAEIVWPKSEDCLRVVRVVEEIKESELYSYFAGKLYKRSILSGVKFINLCRGEDLIFLAECVCRIDSVLMSNNSFYGYRKRENSATMRPLEINVFENMRVSIPRLLSIYVKSGRRLLGQEVRKWFCLMISVYITRLLIMPKDSRDYLLILWYDMMREVYDESRSLFSLSQKFLIGALIKLRLLKLVVIIFSQRSLAIAAKNFIMNLKFRTRMS